MDRPKLATCKLIKPIGTTTLWIEYQIGRETKIMTSSFGASDYHLAQQLKPGTKFRITTRDVTLKPIPGEIEFLPGKEQTTLPYITSIVKTH